MFDVQNGEDATTTQIAASMFQEICYENKDRLRYALTILPSTMDMLEDDH